MERSMFDWRQKALVVALVVAVGVWLLLPRVSKQVPGLRHYCSNNLRQIMLALHNYEQTWGSFPPAVVYSDDGEPLHSWRTLLLPWMEQTRLYEQIRLDKPWNSPHNRQWHDAFDQGYAIYHCPADRSGGRSRAHYLAVVGPETMFPPGDVALKPADAVDGADTTIMLVEVADSDVHWMEPRDLSFEQMSMQVNSAAGGIGSRHARGANVSVVHGGVFFLEDDADPEQVRAALTRDGGERVTLFD